MTPARSSWRRTPAAKGWRVVLLIVLLAMPQPAWALKKKLIGIAAQFLGQEIVSYGFGRALDRLRGVDLESRLREAEREVEGRLPQAEGPERTSLEEELALIRRQLAGLQQLLHGAPSAAELAALKTRVQEDIPRIQRLLQQQGRRVDRLEGDMGDVKARLQALEARLAMPSFGEMVALHAMGFTSASRNLPSDVADAGREALEAELSRDLRVRLGNRPAAVDTLIEGRVLRYSVDRRSYSGYNTRARLTVFHTLEISVALADSTGERRYWSRVYRRTAREFLPAGAHASASDHGVAHELLRSAMEAAAADLIAFIFAEAPPPAADEEVELRR